MQSSARATAVIIFTFAASTYAAERVATDLTSLKQHIKSAQPGDVIVLRDGVWADAEIEFYANGTEAQPITLRAQTPGKTILSGQSNLRIGGRHLVVDGLLFKDGGLSKGHVIALRGEDDQGAENCRVTNCAIVNYNPAEKTTRNTSYLSMWGKNNRVDHCYFEGKNSPGPTFIVWVEAFPNHHRIDHNHFAGRPALGANGGETMRVGTSQVSMNDSYTTVESNYFEACDGEAEIISNKSCENVYRANTFVKNSGALTLRHGNRCRVEGNWFFGHDKPGTGGVRLIGEDHVVVNNYLDGLAGKTFESALPFVNGIPDSKPNEYFRVKRALVAHNTLVNCAQSITFGVGRGARNRVEAPEDCTIANNLIVSPHGPLVRFDDQPLGTTWVGNLFFGADTGLPADAVGIRTADPQLVKGDDHVHRPGLPSPARGAAQGTFDTIKLDIDGQPRTGPRDIGCDQSSDAPTTARPLTPADVGPAFLRTRS